MAAQQPSDLPDFALTAEGVRIFWDELIKTLDQNIEQLDQVVQNLEKIREHLTALRAVIRNLAKRFNSTEHNTNARFANHTAHMNESSLVPLIHFITSEDIDGFPATIGDIAFLNNEMMDKIITALGGTVEGTLEIKRLRLRRLVGAAPLPSD